MDIDLSLLPDDFEDCLTTSHEIMLRLPFRLLDLPPELWIKIVEQVSSRNSRLGIAAD